MPTSLEPILRSAQVRAVEAEHAGEPLMERAGAAAAAQALHMIARAGPVVVLAGPGNNGGDALVVARHLRSRSCDVVVVMPADRAHLPVDTAAALRAFLAAGGTCVEVPRDDAALVVDGLFGIGLNRPPAPPYDGLIAWCNAQAVPTLALDVPSGIDADTGSAAGTCIRASATATFLAWKPGLLTGDGLDCAGHVVLHPLDVAIDAAPGVRLTWDGVAAILPPVLRRRQRGVHKGTFGTLAIVGGAGGMTGAALLAGRGALACGAGKVQVGLLADEAPLVDPGALELMLRRPVDALAGADVLVIGPGLGRDEGALALLSQALALKMPLVLDADALNLVAAERALQDAVIAHAGEVLLTPHPAEAARLLGVTTAHVQRDRLDAALRLARRFDAHVVLKGAGSVVADPQGSFAINATGNPGLASGGTGDVLAGMVGALLAQGIAAREALRIGVCVHGAAADALVAGGTGPIGLRASELPPVVRDLLNARGRGG